MKKLLTILSLTFLLTLPGQAEKPTPKDVGVGGVWTGAWYQTLVPRGYHKQGGELNFWHVDDDGIALNGVLYVEESYARQVFQIGSGTWNYNPKTKKFSVLFTMANGDTFTGSGNSVAISGTFKGRNAGGRYSGKWLAD